MNRRVFWFAIAVFGGTQPIWAQAPPVLVNPQAPNLGVVIPLGMQRGTSLELNLTGTNLAEPTGLWTSFPAKVFIPTDSNNGKDPAKLRVRLDVPSDAPLGFHSIRLATKQGMSNFRMFCIDDLPQVLEVDSNRSPATPQPLPIPCVVVGRTDPEITDYYKINVKAGQRLSMEILGRRLGSSLDPQISLLNSRTGKEVAYSNDAPGLQTDARLTHTFKDAEDYRIEIRDVMYGGGPDQWYRLRIGDFPCATTPIPMAAKRGTLSKVSFAGPSVDGVPAVEVKVPTDPGATVVWVTPRRLKGQCGWPVPLQISDLNEVVEKEPNNLFEQANRVTPPVGITGRLEEKGDVDHYTFTSKKGQRWVVHAHTHELNSPSELYMQLKNSKGIQLAASNPMAEPIIDFTAPADGDMTLAVEHLNYWGGPDESYWITITPFEPSFSLIVGTDRFDVHQGGVTAIPIQAVNRVDYNGPIEVKVVGHPGLTGHGVITAVAPPAPNMPIALLYMQAAGDLSTGPYPFTIQGKAIINGKPSLSYVNVKAVVSQNLAGLPYPPLNLSNQLAAAVTDKAPFTLAAKLGKRQALRGQPIIATITAARQAGFVDEILLTPLYLSPTLAVAIKSIPKGQNQISLSITPAANIGLGNAPVSFMGKAKWQNKDVTVTALPVNLDVVLPFDLKVESASVTLSSGGKINLKVSAARKGGYVGPISLEVRNLPANVTAAKSIIPKNANTAEIQMSAAAGGANTSKADVQVVGTALEAGNQQNATPNFTVNLVKK